MSRTRPRLFEGTPPMYGILILAALVIVAVGVKATGSIVGPIFLVITLVITVSPLRTALVRHRVPGWLASVISLLSIYVLLLAILGSLVWSMAQLVEILPTYAGAFNEIKGQIAGWLQNLGVSSEQVQKALSGVSLSNLSGPLRGLLSGLTSTASLLGLIFVVVVFMAFDAATMPGRLGHIQLIRPNAAGAFSEFAVRVRKYWIVTTVFGLIVATIDTIGLVIIGVPIAATWGVLAFVTNYIPNVGFVLGLIPPALIALFDGGVGTMVAVIVLYTTVNIIVQTIIQPRITGDAVGITATVAFVSLIFWGFLLGALGALLAIPCTLFVKSLLVDHSDAGRWFAALIDADPEKAHAAPPGSAAAEALAHAERKKARRAHRSATEPRESEAGAATEPAAVVAVEEPTGPGVAGPKPAPEQAAPTS